MLVRSEICRFKREISWYEVDHCLCKVELLKLDDKFFMRVVQFDVDIFVQRTELWMILKTINFDLMVTSFTSMLPANMFYVSRSQSLNPVSYIHLTLNFSGM